MLRLLNHATIFQIIPRRERFDPHSQCNHERESRQIIISRAYSRIQLLLGLASQNWSEGTTDPEDHHTHSETEQGRPQ